MAVPTIMSDLSTTAASNSPAGSESPTAGDDFLRAIQAIVRTTNAKGADIASATSTAIGAATGEFVDVTGTTTITSFDTIAAGIVRTVRFTGALTLTHNATSLILPGGANITTAANDTAVFRSLGSGNWQCISYKRQDGTPLAVSSASVTALSLASSAYGYGDIKNAEFTVTMGSSAATIALKTFAATDPSATDPAEITFRNATVSSASWTKRAVTGALSTVISSGSTGGTTSGNLSRIMVLAIDNAGTVELAWCNYAGSVNLDESGVISTTAEGGAGAADSANVIYSTTARSNVPFRVLGYFESTQSTAGTWATSPSTIQGAGGLSTISKSLQTILPASQATTSGTSIDFTGIPAWARKITVMLSGVSTNGTSNLLIQLGDSGGIETSGYLGAGSLLRDATGVSITNFTTGFGISQIAAASVCHGIMHLMLIEPATNTWVQSNSFGLSNAATTYNGGGTKATSAILDRIRLTTVNGTDAFDAGTVNIMYE